MSDLKRLFRLVRKDLIRWLILSIVAGLVLMASAPLALATDQPAIGWFGMVTAGSLFGAGFVPVMRRLLFDYIDLRQVYEASMIRDPGRVFLGVCVVVAALVLSLAGGKAQANVPAQALQVLPVLGAEVSQHWPDAPDWALFAGQIEKESCITLKHSKCWNPRAELRTSREQGIGLGQVTRTARFDSLAELRSQFPRELAGWSWDSPTLYDPAFQVRALLLMDRRNHRQLTGVPEPDRMDMAMAAYNGGMGGLIGERQLCRSTRGCDPNRWTGHVENTSMKSRTVKPGYGQSFFAINRGYPPGVRARAEKYRPLFGGA